MDDIKLFGLVMAGMFWVAASVVSMGIGGPDETRRDRERNLYLASIGLSVFIMALP